MTSKAQHIANNSGSGRSRKIRWLSGSSVVAAAFLLASAPQAVQAQTLLGAPDFYARDIRISAPAEMVAINQAQAVAPRASPNQAFQANVTSASTTPTVSISSNADIVTVSGAETFINWSPLDTANSEDLINILPAGTSLTFVGPSAGYTVLNRILPTGTTASGVARGIAFGGNVTSRLGANTGPVGGNIWFYSPGGIVVGAGAVFDVGGLVLTTNDIDVTGGLFGAGGEIRFSGATDSISSVIIESGATINALNDGSSYVAMVAPRIVQGGTVNIDGSVAYVAAEQAELTINNGLFDIAIGVGTTDANGVVHTGSTVGLASTPTVDGSGNVTDADAQAIYMVAVPKNDALTMLVGGALGYQPAANASIINGNVVLSAGANVATTGNQTNASFAIDKTAADSDSNIQLQNVSFGSSVSTFATNGIVAATASVTDFVIANNSVGTQNLLLEARNQIDINARGGGSIGANGNVTLRAGTDGVGGTININADQIGFADTITSGLLATGNLVVDVSASGLDDFFTVRNNGNTGIGQDAVGGDINININGSGDLVVGGDAQFVASAQGGKGENQNGSAQGGNINLNISSGTFNVTGTTSFETQAIAAQTSKIGGNGPGLIGSDSLGGDVNLVLSGGAVTTGNIVVNLGAIASAGEAAGGVQSNNATSGAFDLTITGGSHIINDLDVNALADASAGSFGAAGTGISGFASSGGANFLIDGGSLTVNSNLDSNLSTYGISPASLADRTTLTVQNGGSLAVTGNININTSAFDGIDTAISTGGSISVLMDNGTITTGGIFLDSSARPNNLFSFTSADEGQDFQAGDISLVAQNGGTFTSGFSILDASATGNDTNAGNGTGGGIFVHANDGSIEFTNSVFIVANGVGGVGGNNENPDSLGIGQGGAINLRVEGTGGNLSFTNLTVESNGSIANDGEGGAPSFNGDGGFGFGGNITFDLLGGTFTANDIMVGSDGSGGGGGDLVTLPGSEPVSTAVSQVTPADLTVVNAPSAGGIPAGDGGDGQGGNVTFNLNGSAATVTNLTISANGFGGDGADGDINYGTAGGNGGRGIGGNATFNAQSGSLTVTSTLTVSADGNNQDLAYYGSRAAGGFGYGSDGGAGGAGIGGTATFNLDGSAIINAAQVVISTDASGGYGGSSSNAFDGGSGLIQAGIAGNGGDATGGDATFNNNAGILNFSELSVTSMGTGGNGGNVSGFSTGDADNIAGNGGTGTGGNAVININQNDPNIPVYVANASGVGGVGGYGLDGGDGGAAFGGIAAININNVTADLDDPTILANATGGAGGEGRTNPTTLDAGNGGNGGNAVGGTARLQVTGASGNIDLGFILIEADAVGGAGGFGYAGFSGAGGDGGSGGGASGGTTEIIARTGGTINFTSALFELGATGSGGAGGSGGFSFTPNQGDGGNGGDGIGGTGRLLAQGGTITGQDVSITSTGQGGAAGLGGNYIGYYGLDGIGGSGTGGVGVIEVQEGSPGIITLGDVTVIVDGYNAGDSTGIPTGFGGRFEITDTSTDPAGLITLASLNVQALNTASGTTSGFFATGNSGAMTILGDLTVNVAGNIEYSLDGDGQMTVGGNASLSSGQNILIDHTNNITPVNSIDVSGTFAATAQGNFTSTDGSRINAADTATVRAEQNATVADIAGVGFVDISALFDVDVNNAAVTGTPTTIVLGSGAFVLGPQMLIQAGFDPGGTPTPTPAPTPTPSYDPNYDATITGDVTSTGFIEIYAGGSALFSSGSSTVSDNGLIVQTGDDIIIQTGASVVAGNNPATTPNFGNPFPNSNNLILQAGSLTPLNTATITPIASIVAAGNIDANDFAVVMSANAIDGLGGTITASSISADINDAPSNAAIAAIGQSDDNGLLSAQCVEGNLCLGTLNADNLVHIGQASNNDVIQGIIESGTVSANDILVTTRRDILMGTDGIATVLDATNQFLVQSTEGNVNLRDAAVSSVSVLVSAVNGSLLGSGSLTSVNDIGISVAGDVNAAAIDTGGQLTTVALVGGGFEASYSVPGNITVGSLTQGGGVNVNVIAGGDISFGQINLPANRSITLTAATGDAFLGSNSSATSISILGNNVGFNDLLSSGNITLNAAIGDLTGIGPGDLTADGTIDLDATGGSVTAGTINGGGGIDIASGGDVVVDALLGGFTNILTTGVVDIGSADTLRLEAQGDSISLGTANITSNAFAASGALVLTATTGAIGITDATTARATTLDAATDINIGSLAATGAFGATAGGNVALGTASGESVVVSAGGDITGLSASAPTNTLSSNIVTLTAAGAINVNTINAAENVDLDAGGAITTNSIQGAFIDAVGAGLVTIGSAAGTRLDVTGQGIALGTANITSNAFAASGVINLDAGGGLIDIQGNIVGSSIMTVSSDMNIGATGSLGQTDLTSDIQIFADGTTQMVLGGTNNPIGVFHLGNDEFSRIHSGGDLTLTTVPTAIGGFDLTVQDLNVLVADNVSGPQSANIGLSNSLNLVSGQSIAVVGFVDFSNANTNSGLNFTAGQDMFINATSGIIQMTDVNGNFPGSGSLSISAPNVFAMTSQALADITGLSAADIDLRLANNDGINLPDGLIRADNVQITVIDNLLIQNTANGTGFADRRGFNVGTLSIAGPSTGNANIVINGIVGGATGVDTIPATDVAIGFDPASTINGCVINNPAGCTPPPTPTPSPTPTPIPTPETPGIDDPVQDVIEEEVTPEKYAADPFATTPMEIKDNADLAEDPLIDEPVTGAGNDDLWVDEEEQEDEDEDEDEDEEEEEEEEKEEDELEPAE